MERDELLAYLRTAGKPETGPLESVLQQTEVIGDPAQPSEADCAALRWVGSAFDLWEQQFPLEDTLAEQLRRLKSVVAEAAILDANFFTPGAHPLHRIFDLLHKAATGWQEGLGRAGQPTLTLVEETVTEVLAMAEERRGELADLARGLVESVQRNHLRAHRMATRAAEAELGRLRAAEAKSTAAAAINDALEKYPATPEIGRLLRGPWYDSAQLVLLKFGEDSDEWKSMFATTSRLLESLQPPDDAPETQRQQFFESVADIPEQVKRWLLSMQHDNEAVEQIVSEIEYAHLRIMRNQPTQLQSVAAIDPGPAVSPRPDTQAALEGVRPGQWFLIRTRKSDLIRVQLSMIEQDYQQLLFCNQAGIKVQTLDFANFQKLLENGTARPLANEATFSLALVAAAGIDSDEELARLTGGPEASRAAGPEAQPGASNSEAHAAQAAPGRSLDVAAAEPVAPQLPDTGLPELPMGTWLGFHDVDPPLLAKLALHDKVRRLLIFVNRKGIEQRRLGEEEYLGLIKDGQVDIMEATNNFREQVERARKRMQNHRS